MKLQTGLRSWESNWEGGVVKKKEIVIEDCEPEVLDIVVNYMYVIEIPDLVCCKAYLEVLTYSLSRTVLSYAKFLTSQRCC